MLFGKHQVNTAVLEISSIIVGVEGVSRSPSNILVSG